METEGKVKVVRTFVCVVPPSKIVTEMERFLADLRVLAPREFKWVGREQFHLTLRFLGEAPASMATAMDRDLRSLEMPPAFEIEIAGAGAFPDLSRPRVLWVGVTKGGGELANLAALAEEAAVAAGYEREPKKFKAHLTFARARAEGTIPQRLQEALANAAKIPPFSWCCESLVLMRSELTPKGPIYTRLGEYVLRA